MARDLSTPLTSITFRCAVCHYTFAAEPLRVEDDPGCDWHPYRYIGICSECGQECLQAGYERALLKAWANSTGPRTRAGKAATAANLKGHPTPEEAKRTRFNALKHGMYAETAQYFPAKPGKYPCCEHCDVDWGYCATQPACIKQTQLFMVHHAAFEQKDPKHLTSIYASIQSAITAVIQQMLQTIINDGVKLEAPAWAVTKEGEIVIGEYTDLETGQMRRIMDVKAHPLLEPLTKFLQRNNLSLADMGMTPKLIDQQDEEQLGNLAQSGTVATLTLEEYAARQSEAIEALRGQMERAKQRKEQDPVLIEHRAQQGDGDGS